MKNDSFRNIALNLCGPEEMTMNEVIDRLSQFHKVKRKKIHLPTWFIRLGISVLSLMKINIVFPDQIPRLLCEKDRSNDATQAVISYNPRNFEEGILFYLFQGN